MWVGASETVTSTLVVPIGYSMPGGAAAMVYGGFHVYELSGPAMLGSVVACRRGGLGQYI